MNCAELSASTPEVDRQLHDARLWSNLRGTMNGEGAAARVARFAPLDCREGMSVGEAWREGWTRQGVEAVFPTWFMAFVLLGLAGAAVLGFVQGRRGLR